MEGLRGRLRAPGLLPQCRCESSPSSTAGMGPWDGAGAGRSWARLSARTWSSGEGGGWREPSGPCFADCPSPFPTALCPPSSVPPPPPGLSSHDSPETGLLALPGRVSSPNGAVTVCLRPAQKRVTVHFPPWHQRRPPTPRPPARAGARAEQLEPGFMKLRGIRSSRRRPLSGCIAGPASEGGLCQ